MLEMKIPRFDVNDNNVTIMEVKVEDGSFVKKNDIIFIAESTKMTREILAEKDGYIKLMVDCYDVKAVGETVAFIFDTESEYKQFKENSDMISKEEAQQINITAKAKALAEQLHIDINELAESKKEGIIKTADVEKYAEKKKKDGNESIFINEIPKAINIYDRERVMIIGAGRLSEQVIDILLDDKDKSIVGIVDSYKTEYNSYSFPLFNCNIQDFPEKIDRSCYDTVIIALGGDKKSMNFRRELYMNYKKFDIRFTNAIGDNTNIRRAVKIGENNIIMHNCFVGTGAQIGNDNIISYGSCIGHHCVIGSHNLFAPGFITPGSVKVGDRNIIMTGVKTINYVTIGNDTIIPVGYNIETNIPDGTNLLNS